MFEIFCQLFWAFCSLICVVAIGGVAFLVWMFLKDNPWI